MTANGWPSLLARRRSPRQRPWSVQAVDRIDERDEYETYVPVSALRDAPEKLRLLAEWFDHQDAREGKTDADVQDDLRRWADAIEDGHK